MSHLIGTLLSFAGFVCLCLAMPRHQRDLLGRFLADGRGRALKMAGYGLLMLALLQVSFRLGWAYGAISWLGHMSLAAWILILLVSWRTRGA
ncbi:DUF3325 domain-containing protein [Gimibacter soli]|uniref:DUF3325 domain-containing protein n=1 Tax=Gimibacter soli TaxID=3024400 RepID=A0AAF0BLZ7_9PROT|nr:DUF3325 domain-containing protein [Gimibacter soli]WCL53970.1 DUF3325 domain-containing protein [Gimibacter soli]